MRIDISSHASVRLAQALTSIAPEISPWSAGCIEIFFKEYELFGGSG
jgi:hypothetical protein